MRLLLAALALAGALSTAHAQGISAREIAGAWPANRAQAGIASFYDCIKPGQCSRSKRTASGEPFNPHAFTAAHRSYPFGTRLRVCGKGDSCVVVRVNDRGPFVKGRVIDVTPAVARAIRLPGVGRVIIERM